MTEQEKLLYNLVKDFVYAIDYDHLDWPADSKEAFEKMLKWSQNNQGNV